MVQTGKHTKRAAAGLPAVMRYAHGNLVAPEGGQETRLVHSCRHHELSLRCAPPAWLLRQPFC